MDNKEGQNELKPTGGDNAHLLRLGVIFLSVVSFFTTANGMETYIFVDNGAIAYAASAAIQGILLALGMNLPGYLGSIWSWKIKSKVAGVLLKLVFSVLALFLTVITTLCSTWFSYIYIAEIIHRDSWGIDSNLLVQQAYRSELYDARDYAHAYRFFVEESVGEKILLLEEQAAQLSGSAAGSGIDWDEERRHYVIGHETTAASYMSTVIEAMEKAMKTGSSQEVKDLAATAVRDAKTNAESRKDDIQQNIDRLNENITSYNRQIELLTNRVNRATADTDIAALNRTINTYSNLISSDSQQQAVLEAERSELDGVLQRLPYYESQLGLSNSTSATAIRSNLLELQSEFFRQDPDEERMLDTASDIFESLRTASSAAARTEGESLSYTNLLVQMNQLIRNLTDYSEIKEIESNLDQLIADLRTMEINSDSQSSLAGEAVNSEETIASGETAVSSEAATPDGAAVPEKSDVSEIWNRRLAELKAQIGAMSMYSSSEALEGNNASALSESQLNILRSYDRNRASENLDDVIRRYLTKRSAIYQGIIYLQSPYHSLAAFAFILALSFDLSGFIFGIVVPNESRRRKGQEEMAADGAGAISRVLGRTAQPKWSILKTLNRYITLTGDYENKDGTYYYVAFQNGQRCRWPVEDTVPYRQGIYQQIKVDAKWSKGTSVSPKSQELRFARQADGPRDGIYTDCQLVYDEGSLILMKEDNQHFLSSVEEYLPVHSYSPSRGANRTIPVKELASKKIDGKTVVIALNTKGTRIAAIYIIEQEA